MNTSGAGFRKQKVRAALALVVLGGILVTGARQANAAGGSATWLTNPSSDGFWTPNPTTDANWSTGAGNAPGSAGGNTNPDIATFNSASTQTSINVAAAITINSIIFDTANVASYTITRTANTMRLSNGGQVDMTSTVTNPETIAGSWNMNFLGSTSTVNVSYNFVNDSTTSSAVLTFSGGTLTNSSGAASGETSTLILKGANTGNNLVSSVITNQTSRPTIVDKEGTGRWILGGTNTYIGATMVNGGILALNSTGSTGASSAVAVGALGTLEGVGTAKGSVDLTGILSPGIDNAASTAGTFNLGSTLKFEAGSQLAFDVGPTNTSADTDLVNFTTLADSLQGSGNATLALAGSIDYTQSYTIFQNVSTAGFTFAGITGYDTVDYLASVNQSGSNYVLTFAPAGAAPEPASLGILGAGVAAMMLRRRRA